MSRALQLERILSAYAEPSWDPDKVAPKVAPYGVGDFTFESDKGGHSVVALGTRWLFESGAEEWREVQFHAPDPAGRSQEIHDVSPALRQSLGRVPTHIWDLGAVANPYETEEEEEEEEEEEDCKECGESELDCECCSMCDQSCDNCVCCAYCLESCQCC